MEKKKVIAGLITIPVFISGLVALLKGCDEEKEELSNSMTDIVLNEDVIATTEPTIITSKPFYTASPNVSVKPVNTPKEVIDPTPIVTPTINPTTKPTTEPKATLTPVSTSKPRPTATPSPTSKPSPTVAPTPTVVPTPTLSPSPIPTIEPTSRPRPTMVPSDPSTPRPTATLAPTSTPSATSTPSPTVVPTPTSTPCAHSYTEWLFNSMTGQDERHCLNCGATESKNHVHNNHLDSTDSVYEHWKCDACGFITDIAHIFGEGTICQNPNCNYVKEETHSHTWKQKVVIVGSEEVCYKNVNYCSDCGMEIDADTFTHSDLKVTEGRKTIKYECTRCGWAKEELKTAAASFIDDIIIEEPKKLKLVRK